MANFGAGLVDGFNVGYSIGDALDKRKKREKMAGAMSSAMEPATVATGKTLKVIGPDGSVGETVMTDTAGLADIQNQYQQSGYKTEVSDGGNMARVGSKDVGPVMGLADAQTKTDEYNKPSSRMRRMSTAVGKFDPEASLKLEESALRSDMTGLQMEQTRMQMEDAKAKRAQSENRNKIMQAMGGHLNERLSAQSVAQPAAQPNNGVEVTALQPIGLETAQQSAQQKPAAMDDLMPEVYGKGMEMARQMGDFETYQELNKELSGIQKARYEKALKQADQQFAVTGDYSDYQTSHNLYPDGIDNSKIAKNQDGTYSVSATVNGKPIQQQFTAGQMRDYIDSARDPKEFMKRANERADKAWEWKNKPAEIEKTLRAAGIKEGSKEWKSAMRSYVNKETTRAPASSVSISLPSMSGRTIVNPDGTVSVLGVNKGDPYILGTGVVDSETINRRTAEAEKLIDAQLKTSDVSSIHLRQGALNIKERAAEIILENNGGISSAKAARLAIEEAKAKLPKATK